MCIGVWYCVLCTVKIWSDICFKQRNKKSILADFRETAAKVNVSSFLSPLIVRPNFFFTDPSCQKVDENIQIHLICLNKVIFRKIKMYTGIILPVYRTNFIFRGFNCTTLPLLNYIVSILAFAFCRKSHKTVLKEFLKTVFLYSGQYELH